MEITILGQKLRVELIILCMIIGGFIGVNMFCSCAGGIKEGFVAAEDLMGAAINYSMGNGVKGSWANAEAKKEVKMKKGGSVSSASKRADGCVVRGKTKGKIC